VFFTTMSRAVSKAAEGMETLRTTVLLATVTLPVSTGMQTGAVPRSSDDTMKGSSPIEVSASSMVAMIPP
jgi:hypothetical protein